MRKLRFCLSPDETRALIEAPVNLTHRGVIVMGACCGFRVGETVNMKWDWIDFERKSITVQANTRPIKWHPKRWSLRVLFPNGKVFDFLRVYRASVKSKNYVFSSNRKSAHYRLNRDYAIQVINSYAKKIKGPECPHLGRAIGSHALRRTYASTVFAELERNGLSFNEAISTVQKLLGHRNPQVTADYLFLADEEDKVRSVADIDLYFGD